MKVSIKPIQSAVAEPLLRVFARAGIAKITARLSTNPKRDRCFLIMRGFLLTSPRNAPALDKRGHLLNEVVLRAWLSRRETA
jgi:hypothetical protein